MTHSSLIASDPYGTTTIGEPVACAVSALMALSRLDVPVLLEGERGAGKKLLARALHEQSMRHDAPFIVIECAGKRPEALARELFGYFDAPASGADPVPGKIEAAHGGTLYIEDVEQLPLAHQNALVRALASGEFSPIGSSVPRAADIRLICSSGQDVASQLAQGRIAGELYRAVGSAKLVVPPLRTRARELGLLADHFARESARELGVPDKSVSPAVVQAFARYRWPGNLHELRDVVRAATSKSGDVIELESLPGDLIVAMNEQAAASAPSGFQGLELAEYRAIRDCLEATRGNLTRTARELRIARSTLYAKLKKYGLEEGIGGLRVSRDQALMMHA